MHEMIISDAYGSVVGYGKISEFIRENHNLEEFRKNHISKDKLSRIFGGYGSAK